MNSASARIWTFATVIIIIATIALGWFLGAAPKLAEISRVDSERAAVAAQNQQTRAVIAQIQEDFERLDEFQEQLDELRAEFPELPAYADAVETFLSVLLDNDLVLENLVIGAPEPVDPTVVLDEFGQVPAGTLLKLDVTATVAGGLDSALGYVNALQTSDRFTIVPRFQYAGGTEADTQSTTITIAIYVIADQPAPGAVPLDGVVVEESPEQPAEESTEEPPAQ